MIELKLRMHNKFPHCITHYPSAFNVCTVSDNLKYINHWNKNKWERLTENNRNFTKRKWFHMALYVMAKYPQWNKI